jgi:hypothetical protein
MGNRVFLALLVLVFMTCRPSLAGKPVLEVWTGKNCGACARFWRDYQSRPDFRGRLDAAFSVRSFPYEKYAVAGRLKMIRALPTFLAPCRRVQGYTDPARLIAQLRLPPIKAPPMPNENWNPPEKNPPPRPPAPPAPPTAGADELAELKTELAELRLAVNTALTAKGETIIVVEGPPGRDGRDADTAQLAAMADRVEYLADLIGSNATAAANADLALAERVRDLESQNRKLTDAVFALEKWRQEHRVTVEILDPSGQVIKSERFNFDEPIQFQLRPTRTETRKPEMIGF